jgi:hypothetical protein
MQLLTCRCKPVLLSPLVVTLLLTAAAVAPAADWYVAPQGQPKAQGTRTSPWDLESALLGKRGIGPGDTLYLLAGTYRRRPDEKFAVKLVGAAGRAIQVRPAPGERAIIDGGLMVQDPSAQLWIRDLEILVSEPQPVKPVGPGSFPGGFNRPWGGLHIYGGKQCKYLHLVIHDCRQGISAWSGARDDEIHGCLIHDNGWPATDRGHRHAIYTQNKDGTRSITDCIMTGGHGYTIHAYGSRNAYVDNFLIEGNIAYQAGTFLVGGGRPSRHIRVLNNYLFGAPLQVGYAAPYNEDCEVLDNIVVNGTLSINKYKKVLNEGNLVLPKNAARPTQNRVVLRPSKYDPDRAHLVLFHWDKGPDVEADLGTFLKQGDHYRLLNPRDFFGRPILSGVFDGRRLRVAVTGEFAAFVVVRAHGPNPGQGP